MVTAFTAKCKKLVGDEVVTLFLNYGTLEEMREVMIKSEFLVRFETVTEIMVEKYLEQLAKKRFHRPVPKEFTFTRNPDDEPYID